MNIENNLNIIYENKDNLGSDLITQLGSGVLFTQKLYTQPKTRSVVIDKRIFNELRKFFEGEK